jgi:hypothetical protein
MSEAATLQEIRLALGREQSLRLFRNNTGMLRDEHGRPVRFGLHPGSSDLIGWRSILVTPEMVGTRLAAFCSIEVKRPGGRHPVTAEQQAWIDAVAAAGGFAGVARNPGQARLLLGLPT